VIFTPKSLLRHPKVVSDLDDFCHGEFQPVIMDQEVDVKKTKTLVFCTGKFYYDLLETREQLDRKDVALVRLEQLFPLPTAQIREILGQYAHVNEIVWAQEEPRNMGAWSHLLLHLPEAREFRVASRRFYGAPAAGSATRSKRRHQEVIDYVFDKTKNNMR
jgi:2-oxoglutarate dehydrogenase E1 component